MDGTVSSEGALGGGDDEAKEDDAQQIDAHAHQHLRRRPRAYVPCMTGTL